MLSQEGQAGLARELARMNLPANIYTQWYWKVDLHNLFHFLRLRADAHAQMEIRVYAEAIAEIDGVSEVYSVTGTIDLIVLVRARRNEEVADIVSDRLNKVPGVVDTETHIAFRALSKHDLEAAFSLGYDE